MAVVPDKVSPQRFETLNEETERFQQQQRIDDAIKQYQLDDGTGKPRIHTVPEPEIGKMAAGEEGEGPAAPLWYEPADPSMPDWVQATDVDEVGLRQLNDVVEPLSRMFSYTPGDRESTNVDDHRFLPPYNPPAWVDESIEEMPFQGVLEAATEAGLAVLGSGDRFAGHALQAAVDVWDSIKNFMASGDEQSAIQVAAAFASGGFARGAVKSAGKIGGQVDELGVFGGIGAQGSPGGLEIAMQAKAAGISSKEIQDTTGWFKAPDGNWKFFIDDRKMKWKPINKNIMLASRLGDLVEHPELFKRYIDAADYIHVVQDDSIKVGNAEFTPGQGKYGTIYMHPDDLGTQNGRKILVHEIQHWIQRQENFPRGSSPQEFMLDTSNNLYGLFLDKKSNLADLQGTEEGRMFLGYVNSLLNNKIGAHSIESKIESVARMRKEEPEMFRKLVGHMTEHISIQRYLAQSGEVEARLAADMLNMTDKQIAKMDFATAGDIKPWNREYRFNPNNIPEASFDTFKGGKKQFENHLDRALRKSAEALRKIRETGEPIHTRDIDLIEKSVNSSIENMKNLAKRFNSKDIGALDKVKLEALGMTPEMYKNKLISDLASDAEVMRRRAFEIMTNQDPGKVVTQEKIVDWLKQSGVDNIKIRKAPTGTKYISFDDPTNLTPRINIRMPSDGHLGSAKSMEAGGNKFDLGARPGKDEAAPFTASNISGETYREWENLVAGLKFRLSRSPDGQWLISPDKSPVLRSQTRAAKAVDTDDVISKDPNQLELDL